MILAALRWCGRWLGGTLRAWRRDHASLMAAALSFYSLVSIAPLLIVLVALAGSIFEPAALEETVRSGISPWAGPEATELIGELLGSTSSVGSRWTATLVGLALVLYGSMRVFAELQRALSAIWYGPHSRFAEIRSFNFVRTHLSSFAMLLGIGTLWLVGVVASTAISAVDGWWAGRGSSSLELARWTHTAASLLLLTLALGLVYRVLPDTRKRWRDVWPGAAVAAALLTAGGKLIGFYLGYTSIRSLYGAAGSLVVIVFWFYYSWLVFFFGAELIKVLTTEMRRGDDSGLSRTPSG